MRPSVARIIRKLSGPLETAYMRPACPYHIGDVIAWHVWVSVLDEDGFSTSYRVKACKTREEAVAVTDEISAYMKATDRLKGKR